MSDTAPALKTMFRLIKKKFLREILTVDSKPLEVDWSLDGDVLIDELYKQFAKLHNSDQSRFARICTLLFDINAVCQDNRRGRYISDCVKKADKYGVAISEMGELKPSAHLWVSWVYLRMPVLWEKLKRTAHVKQVIGLGGQKRYIKKPESNDPSKLQKDAFEDEFLKYMEREKTMITCLHVEREDLGSFVRYVLHVNPFPKEVEQFDTNGEFKLQLDKNAEGFTIVHHKGESEEPFLRIKCEFNTSQKKRILELFAKFMLSTEICDKPPEEYPIASLNKEYKTGFKLKVSDPLVVTDARISSAALEIIDPASGFVDELIHRCPEGDIFERLTHSCRDFPISWRRPMAWEFEITIVLDPEGIVQSRLDGKDEVLKYPKTKTYRVRVTANNIIFETACHDEKHKRIILDTLAANGIKNVFKKEILAREYRK